MTKMFRGFLQFIHSDDGMLWFFLPTHTRSHHLHRCTYGFNPCPRSLRHFVKHCKQV